MRSSDDNHGAENDVERAILAHLRAQPGAVDTARGVRDWWLAHLHPPPSQELVLAVLQRLAQQGAVSRIANPGQPPLWASAESPDRID